MMGFQDFEAHLRILFNLMAQSWGTFSQAWENPSSKVSREDFIDKKNQNTHNKLIVREFPLLGSSWIEIIVNIFTRMT